MWIKQERQKRQTHSQSFAIERHCEPRGSVVECGCPSAAFVFAGALILPRAQDPTTASKAPEKTGALQKLRHFQRCPSRQCLGYGVPSAAFHSRYAAASGF